MLSKESALHPLHSAELLRRAEYELIDAMPRAVRSKLNEVGSTELLTFTAADMLRAGAPIDKVLRALDQLAARIGTPKCRPH